MGITIHEYIFSHQHSHRFAIIQAPKYSKYSLQFSARFAPLKSTNFIVIHSNSQVEGTVGTRGECDPHVASVASVASVLRVRCFHFYSRVVVAVFFISSFQSVCIELCKLNCKCVLLTLAHTHSCNHTLTHSHSYMCRLHSWQLKSKQTPPPSPQQQLFKHTLTHSHTHSLTHSPTHSCACVCVCLATNCN